MYREKNYNHATEVKLTDIVRVLIGIIVSRKRIIKSRVVYRVSAVSTNT